MQFEKYEDKNGEWRWRLKAANGRVVADGAEGYSSEGNVDRALQTLRSAFFNLAKAPIVTIKRPSRSTLRTMAGWNSATQGAYLLRLVAGLGFKFR